MIPAVVDQLNRAGLDPYITGLVVETQHTGAPCVRFTISLEGLTRLALDPRFGLDPLCGTLHKEVGPDLIGFRSWRNTFGLGSLQVVISKQTLAGYADVDKFNTQDVVNILGHAFGDVIPNWFKKKLRKKK